MPIFLHFFYAFIVFLINALIYLCVFCKFFYFICYLQLILNFLPMLNPYLWPTNIVRFITSNYIRVIKKLLPQVNIGLNPADTTTFFALQLANCSSIMCLYIVNLLVVFLEKLVAMPEFSM